MKMQWGGARETNDYYFLTLTRIYTMKLLFTKSKDILE